ncbi:hypothetical protein J6590_104197 [Homalodisca vitripennis]|nr:hypothetical protein J6590_104197 [Homalodisca vitripennis]
MPRVKRFNKQSYRGNQFRKNSSELGLSASPGTSESNRPRPKQSSSSKKINDSKLPKFSDYDINNVNIIIDLQQISGLIKSFTACKYFNSSDCIDISLDEDFKCGIVHRRSDRTQEHGMRLTATVCEGCLARGGGAGYQLLRD